MSKKLNEFSVALGLFDFINPIFYCVTTVTILGYMFDKMNKSLFIIYVIGALLSMIFGLAIPTVKIIVGLGVMKFKMPVNLVLLVNTGIFISGMSLFANVYKVKLVIMLIIIAIALGLFATIYMKNKKLNTVAVLIGMVGYLMIYCSLITMAISIHKIVSIIMYAIAIILFIYLVLVGCCSDLKKAKVHWAIEISNVICQGLVAISTLLLLQ